MNSGQETGYRRQEGVLAPGACHLAPDLRELCGKRVVELPDAFLPAAQELPGEMARLAQEIDAYLPGQGARLTIILCQIFPSQTVYFRNADKWLRAWRDHIIRSLYDQGNISIHELATMCALSQRQIENILGEAGKPVDDRQLKLF